MIAMLGRCQKMSPPRPSAVQGAVVFAYHSDTQFLACDGQNAVNGYWVGPGAMETGGTSYQYWYWADPSWRASFARRGRWTLILTLGVCGGHAVASDNIVLSRRIWKEKRFHALRVFHVMWLKNADTCLCPVDLHSASYDIVPVPAFLALLNIRTKLRLEIGRFIDLHDNRCYMINVAIPMHVG